MATPSPATWQPPSLEELQAALPEFQFEELLGRGGMGAVFKAVQTSLGRTVAIKVLPVALMEREDAGYAARFEREARITGGLNHPGIVSVYGFGRTPGGLLYMVMEHVNGTDLARRLRDGGPLAPEKAAALLAQVCEALETAHRAGIVHRDLKPANLLLTRDGAVKIADFGLAKVFGVQPSGCESPGTDSLKAELPTVIGATVGTAEYSAPEMLTPGATVDARADLYALGVVLYQMLTGEPPRGRWKLPGAAGSDGRFDAVIQKAMQADPAARFQSAAEMQRALLHAGNSRRGLRRGVFTAAVLGLTAAVWFWWPRSENQPGVADGELSTRVTNTNNDGPGSLRAALANAYASAGPDQITFDPSLSGSTITISGGNILLVAREETPEGLERSFIEMNAAGLPGGLTIRGGGACFIFNEGNRVSIQGVTFSGGTNPYGGILLNSGELTLTDCKFTDNHAGVNGGALGNNGTLRLTRCTFSGNSAQKNGGAFNSLGTVIAEDCTFSGNTGGGGGAVIIGGGTAEFTRCTFHGNEARRIGGAVAIYAAVKATHCTFAGNKCSGTAADTHGGGAFGFMETEGTLALDACIVAGNTAATGNGPDIWRQAGKATAVRSLIGIGKDTSLVNGQDGNLVGTEAAPIDPRLSPLGDFDGPVSTMPPLPGSPALGDGGKPLMGAAL